jgi:type IX secretion system PorP/SprF family membrane protein
MIRKTIISILVLLGSDLFAQQNMAYSQYMVNSLGLNPAFAGENGPFEIIMGSRTQWVGFPGAPRTNFAGFCKALGKKGFYHSWHGVGAYVEADNVGAFSTKTISVMYAWHKRLAHNYNLSAGVSVGGSIYSMDNSLENPNDPALATPLPNLFIFPIINPGIRLYSRKLYFDLSGKQVLANRTVDLEGQKELGVNERLMPEIFFTVGRQFISPNYAWTFTPSVQLISAVTYFPTFNLNLLVYYHRVVGVGISYRDRDAISAMLQFRFKNKIILGLAFDYSVSQFANTGANSREVIFGYTPYGKEAPVSPGSHIAQCPGFDL